MVAIPTTEMETETSSRSRTDSEILILDAHTFKDLEVFGSQTGGTSLFKFCNLSRSDGGSRVLRRRIWPTG